jgi:peptide/nickel transport system permease protein
VLIYTLKRILQSIPVIIGVAIIGFILLHLLPGGPARAIIGTNHPSPAKIAALNHQLGLDKPLVEQFLIWFFNLIRGHLGQSYVQNTSVANLLAENLPQTLWLIGLSLVISLILAIPVAIYQATHRNRFGDHLLTAVNLFLFAMPSFWLGLLLIIWFGIDLRWFPVGGIVNSNASGLFPVLLSRLHHMFLPALVLALGSVAGWSQYLRSSVLDAITQDYVRTARAKGVAERVVLYKHILRNSLITVISLIGLSLPALVGGAVIIENVFNYPGMGLLYVQSAEQYDFPPMLALIVIIAVFTVAGNLLADLLYAAADPRVRFD